MTPALSRELSSRTLLPLAMGAAVGLAVALSPALPVLLLGALVVCLAGLARPWVMVALIFIAMLLDKAGTTGMAVSNLPVTASKLAVVGSLGLWSVHALLSGKRILAWHPVLTAMIGMVAALAITTAHAGTLRAALPDFMGIGMLTVLVALVYSSLAEARLDALYRVVALGLLAALVSSVVAGAASGGRGAGTMGDPNEWGAMVLLLAPFTLGALASDRHWTARPLRLGILLLAPAAVLICRSRAAFVVGLLVAPACLWLMRAKRAEVMGVVLLAGLATPLTVDLDAATERYHTLVAALSDDGGADDASLSERAELVAQAQDLIVNNLVFGVGPGNFRRATGYLSPAGGTKTAHNTYLQVASEQGLVGLVALLGFGVTVAWTLYLGIRRITEPIARTRLVGVAIGLGAIALMAATLGLLTFAMAYLVLAVGLVVLRQALAVARDPALPDAPTSATAAT